MQAYKCNVCGNVIEVLRAGGGGLVCCGQPMELLREKASGAPEVELCVEGENLSAREYCSLHGLWKK